MCREGESYLFLPGFFFPVGWHPRMDDKMDGWMDGSRDEKSFTKNNHDVLYYIYNAS
jgi:hypothetical protein